MIKKIKTIIKLQIPAGLATPSPPVGPILGQHGVNIMEFCKTFNNKTKEIEKSLPVPIVITIYSDRSFTFIIKSTPASVLLKKAANIKCGSKNAGVHFVGTVSREQMLDIVKCKLNDLTGSNIDSMLRSIEGTARSMGIKIS